MPFEVEFTDEFEVWWDGLSVAEQISMDRSVRVLMDGGPTLGRPHVDTLKGSSLPNLKELRAQHEGRPYRMFFVFDPQRAALLLIGGDKTGNNRFYEEMIPKAEAIYAQRLREMDREDKDRKG
jgi:hypothetical protein